MKTKLTELAKVIRSKNSGPYEITFDVIFKDQATYAMAVDRQLITKSTIASLYHIKESEVIALVHFTPANAIKATIIRPMASGDIRETDVYGAQQHAPLLDLEFEL